MACGRALPCNCALPSSLAPRRARCVLRAQLSCPSTVPAPGLGATTDRPAIVALNDGRHGCGFSFCRSFGLGARSLACVCHYTKHPEELKGSLSSGRRLWVQRCLLPSLQHHHVGPD